MHEYLILRRDGAIWSTTGRPPKKSKGGRPRIHPDRKAYKAEKERERRARLKLAKPNEDQK